MLEFNQAWLTGYLINEPMRQGRKEDGDAKVWFKIRCVRLPISSLKPDLEPENEINRFQELLEKDPEEACKAVEFDDIMIFYDGTDLYDKLESLHRHDFVFIKGAYNVHKIMLKAKCEACGEIGFYEVPMNAVYPIDVIKINSARGMYGDCEDDDPIPNQILIRHYFPLSNQMLLQAIVVQPPKMITSKKNGDFCLLQLGVNRHFFIKTQDDTLAEYPVVYAYYDEGEWAYQHLKRNSGVYYQCSIHPKKYNRKEHCQACGAEIKIPMEQYRFIPIKRIHAANYISDEKLALRDEVARLRSAQARLGV